jgi:hypothetical protein
MLQTPTSAAVSSRPDAEEANVQPSSRPLLEVRGYRPRAADGHLLVLLCEHQVLTTLTLTGWRRLPNGLSYADPRTGVDRRLAADAELTVRLGGIGVRAFLFARTDRIPRTRLGPVVTRWSAYLATAAPATSPHLPIAALVLTPTERQRMTVLEAALGVASATERVAVAAVEPGGGALAADAVWRTAAGSRDRRLVDVLAHVAEASR